MSEINDLPLELEEPTHTFQLDIVGAVTRKRFLGEFTCRVATIRDQCMTAAKIATMNGEYGPFVPQEIQKINKMIAYLRYTLIDAPTFWKKADFGYTLRDPNVIQEVYDQVLAYEEKWLESVWGKEGDDEDSKEK